MVIAYIAIFLLVCYSILIIFYWLAWRSTDEFITTTSNPSTTVSLIIAARDEEKNIGALLESLQRQTYPRHLLEVIVIDDHSNDGTATIAKLFPGTVLVELKNDPVSAHKKMAIQQGINIASGELILTTDADCIAAPNWVQTMASFYEKNRSRFIAAPVVFQSDSSLLQLFQGLDFLVLQGITAATVHRQFHSMCNGANLAYEREAFLAVNGFKGIDQIASGDDMLLMQKIWKRFPGQVHYLKSRAAIVSTQPMKTWKEFFNQRIRWASKARFYQEKGIIWTLLLVYLFNLSFLALLVAGCWLPVLWIYLVILLLAKTIIELPFVYSVARFFKKQSLLKYFFLFQPLHIAYTIVAGWLGQFGTYEWKGRRVK